MPHYARKSIETLHFVERYKRSVFVIVVFFLNADHDTYSTTSSMAKIKFGFKGSEIWKVRHVIKRYE